MNTKYLTKTILTLLLMLMIVIGASACGEDSDVTEVKEQAYTVDMLGVHPDDGGTTYGDFIESYCPGGKWKSDSTAAGERIVNYTGGDAPEGEIVIQWVKGESGWSVWAVEIDETAISMAQINTIFSSEQ
jgi:hypothetical protein